MSEKDEGNLLAMKDAAEIWEIIQKHIPKLISDLEEILTKKSD